MKRRWDRWIVLGTACAACLEGTAADWPAFDEVYQLLRSNLVGVSEADLNRAAVAGMLDQLRSRVRLAMDQEGGPQETSPEACVAATRVFEPNLAYVRFSHIEAGAAEAFRGALAGLTNRNDLEGLVLDLRFADGTDYGQAGQVADCFISQVRPLVRWGDSAFEATSKTNAFDRPVAVLVNGETKGAAEALAAVLSEAEVALLLGSATAGQASLFREFPLSNGQRLRIASTPVRVGDDHEVPPTGIKPDIAVTVRPEDERLLLEDPYRVLSRAGSSSRRASTTVAAGSTNRPARITEADLVRMRREGLNPDDTPSAPARAVVPETPVVTDPALARALDLLKGLAVLRARR